MDELIEKVAIKLCEMLDGEPMANDEDGTMMDSASRETKKQTRL